MRKSRIGRIAAYLLMVLLMCGCSPDNGTNEPATPEPEKKKLAFSTLYDKLHLWAGDETVVSILTDGSFDIGSIDNETAVIEPISVKAFKIKAKRQGITGIGIRDEEQNDYGFTIFVSENLTGQWRDDADSFKYVVDVSDPDTKTAIENEFGSRMVFFYGTEHSFKDENKTFTVYHGAGELSGTYTFDIHARRMEFMYDGHKDILNIRTNPEFSGGPLILDLDLTDYYKSIYPDKGVSKVFNSRLIYRNKLEFEHMFD